jgi:hypothetical protein
MHISSTFGRGHVWQGLFEKAERTSKEEEVNDKIHILLFAKATAKRACFSRAMYLASPVESVLAAGTLNL